MGELERQLESTHHESKARAAEVLTTERATTAERGLEAAKAC